MNLALLKDGFFVMFIGMGTVFSFLIIMSLAMTLNGKILAILNKYFPEETPIEKTSVKNNMQKDDELIAVALACALVKSYQKR